MSRTVPLTALVLALAASPSEAQVYGYTDDNGVLILSNVPTGERMRLIVDEAEEPSKRVWRYSGQYDELILRASKMYGVDAALVRAVIAVESAFNRYAKSHKNAHGLMQLIPETARRYGVGNVYDPWQNIRGGTAYLKEQILTFRDLRLALAAYNAGPNAVKRYGAVPPYRETQNYVKKVLAIYGAGTKIEIIKGDKVYSIGQPGGSTRVTQFHQSQPTGPNARPSRLSELARRYGKKSSLAEAARRNQARIAAAGAASRAAESDSSHPSPGVYYRFTDAEGVVHITREPPEAYAYDVLEP